MTVDTDPILDELQAVERCGFGRFDVFRDWVHLMVHAFVGDDEQYLNRMSRYDDANERHDEGDRPADHFSIAMGELLTATEEAQCDVLGEVYEGYGLASEEQGQFFTPHGLVDLMVQITDGPDAGDDDVERISDPACGSGRFLIEKAQQADERVVCYGVDQDGLCARMAVLNCCLFNVDAAIVHGDSLTFDSRGAWRTHHTPEGGVIEPVEAADVGFEMPEESPEEDEPAPPTQTAMAEWVDPA